MNEKNLPKSYWAQETNTVVYLMNRCTTSGVHEVTSHEKYFRKTSDLSHTRIFGVIAYMHIPDEKRKKLDLNTRTEGVQMLQSFYPKCSSKSRRCFRRIRILVHTREDSDSNPDQRGISRTRERRWRSP